MANYKLGPVIGKLGGGSEVQEWYYNHASKGEIPKDKQNPVIAKVEEATPGEPALVMIDANMRNQQNHNGPWEEIMGGWSGGGYFRNGKVKYVFIATAPGELRLTGFNGYIGSGLYHTRAYIVRFSDYVPV